MIENFLELFDRGLNQEVESNKFSIQMENFLIDHYDEMLLENHDLTLYVNDVIPDITEIMEPAHDPTDFLEKMRKQRNYIKRFL